MQSLPRRAFLGSVAASAALISLSRPLAWAASAAEGTSAAPTPTPAPALKPEWTPLRRGVGLFSARGGTIGWLVNDAACVAVDSQFPQSATVFLEQLPGRAGRTLDCLINTHHHGDHTGGNAVFRPAVKTVVSQANVPDLMRANAERRKETLDPASVPDTTFAQTWRQEFGDEVVHARYHGPAHTKGDIIVTFEKANVVHMGDLLFNRLYPVIDRPGGASIKKWIQLLESVAKEYPADALYIFGHGNPRFGVTGKRGDLWVLRDYLSGLLDYVEKARARGESKERIVALENLPGFADFHQPLPNRLGANLGVAFDELEAGS